MQSYSKLQMKMLPIFFRKADRSPSMVEIKIKMPNVYHDIADVAFSQEATNLPPHRSYDHKKGLLSGDHKFPRSRARPCSPSELRVIKRWLDDPLGRGWIRPSTSPDASPILAAKKPRGGIRICHYFRGMNNISIKNRYPLPLIKETLDLTCGAKLFTKVDIVSAFSRVRIAEGHEWLTMFITRYGPYEQLVTPFSLSTAPAIFQRYINDIIYDVLDKYATAYLDDIIIFSNSEEEHIKHVREVLKRLRASGLQIDIDKCDFYTKKTKYLGLIITLGAIEMNPERVKAILE
ncbi:hypothetical protein K3495_g7124 [Podosphaera aphanis]|nr:hypothetical protein K3495_g7124 [Podosphaera aphanis]